MFNFFHFWFIQKYNTIQIYRLMQSPSNYTQFHNISSDNSPKFVSIDENWLSSHHHTIVKQSLITCPICYSIPLDYPYECSKCERLFCKKDYQKVVSSLNQAQNRCPTCKLSPWVKKQHIHISYKHMFDSLRLKCKICAQNDQFQLLSSQFAAKEMTKQELIEHLQEKHNMFLSEESILYDYVFVSENGIELKLNWLQNLQMNIRKSMELERFQIGGNAGKVLTIDLKQMTSEHPTLGKCKINPSRSKTLRRNRQYLIWTVDISDKTHQSYIFQNQIHEPSSYFDKSEKQRFVFYSQEFQSLIEKSYQQFLRNQRLNEFCLDVRQTRFRISFQEMTQTNTFTKSKKPILRVPFILR